MKIKNHRFLKSTAKNNKDLLLKANLSIDNKLPSPTQQKFRTLKNRLPQCQDDNLNLNTILSIKNSCPSTLASHPESVKFRKLLKPHVYNKNVLHPLESLLINSRSS